MAVEGPGYTLSTNNVLSPDVVSSIQRVLNIPTGPTADPLDILSSDFNPVETLNKLFPDETSLSEVETVQVHLTEDHRALEAEIASLRAELRTDQDPNRMQLIQSMISELMGQMTLIREKASESEAVVRNITKDIQMLDLAKKNLILSMTTLRRFQMLANALSQLELFVEESNYTETAQSLAAVRELSASFKPYLAVPRISHVWTRIQTTQGILRSKLEKIFDKFFLPDGSKTVSQSVVSSACTVVDVLGDDFQTHLVNRFCATELKDYRRIFRATDEAGQLDNISRRFAFFRRVLQNYDNERGRVFPSEWKVGHHLCARFVEITRDDMTAVLGKTPPTVTVLLEALQQVLDFETYVSKKYAMPLIDILKLASGSTRLPKSIASAFEPHMGVFIEAQNKALADMLAPHRGNKSRSSLEATVPTAGGDNSGPAIVLPSSTELFYFYAQSLEQCARFSTGKPLHDLALLHKKWLKIYAEDVLIASLKKPANQPRKSMESRYDVNELKNACLMVNTADYCQTTALELEENIKDKVDDDYKDKLTFQPERDLFINAITWAISVILKELEAACEGPFMNMTRTVWANIENVSGASIYMGELTRSIDQVVDTVRPLIDQKKYLRNFYDKVAGLIVARFTNSLVKSRPLKEVGAEQLLFDLQELTACLLRLPGEPSSTSTYAKSVLRSTTRLDKLLKVIIIPSDPPEGFILNYTLLIGDASFSNFQKVLDLKGTPRTEQNNLLDSFVTITSTKNELQSSSFLSSLDMEPSATTQLASLGSPGGSRASLLLGGTGGAVSATDSIFSALASPPPTGNSATNADMSRTGEAGQKREVFSDFRRFVSFGLRRDTSS